MKTKDFFDFSVRCYEFEQQELSLLVSRIPFALTANVLLMSALFYITEKQWVSDSLVRVDVFLYYTAFILSFVSLVLSFAMLAMAVRPLEFSKLPSMLELRSALMDEDVKRSDYQDALCHRVCQATDNNREQNRKRSRWLFRSVWFSLAALIFLFLEIVLSIPKELG